MAERWGCLSGSWARGGGRGGGGGGGGGGGCALLIPPGAPPREHSGNRPSWNHASLSGNPASRAHGVFGACRTKPRSEEHTSELQSQSNLVCRLLLEKKKKMWSLSCRHGCRLVRVSPTP